VSPAVPPDKGKEVAAGRADAAAPTTGENGKAASTPVAAEPSAEPVSNPPAATTGAAETVATPLPVLQPNTTAPRADADRPLPPIASDPLASPRPQAIDTSSLATSPPTADADRLVRDLPAAAPPIARVPPPATPPPPARTPDPAPSEEANVRAVLAQFEAAYSALSASAAQAVWPSVDERSLAKAFDSLQSQHVSLGKCSITINDRTAAAICTGLTSWTPKVGGGRNTASRTWHFQLASVNGKWRVDRAEARPGR
jgi:hypothetical protein